jgi:hypothetical protein
LALKKQQYSDEEIAIFDEAVICQRRSKNTPVAGVGVKYTH